MKHGVVVTHLRCDPAYAEAEAELQPLLDIAGAVVRLRQAIGWSQAELARRAGTRQANISKLENALANPTPDFLNRVAAALECICQSKRDPLGHHQVNSVS
jgi:predicted transcriptional regulator